MIEPKEDVLAPFVPADPLMAMMWFPALRCAIGNPEILKAFRTDTGNQWQPGRTPLERMVDEATGADSDFVRAFAAWFNVNIWGD